MQAALRAATRRFSEGARRPFVALFIIAVVTVLAEIAEAIRAVPSLVTGHGLSRRGKRIRLACLAVVAVLAIIDTSNDAVLRRYAQQLKCSAIRCETASDIG